MHVLGQLTAKELSPSSRSKVVRGSSRSLGVGPTLCTLEPLTPELAHLPSDSLNGDLYQSYHPGRRGDDEMYKLHSVGGLELVQARGLRRACAVVPGGMFTGRQWPSRFRTRIFIR
eukprot:5265226-Pleurochrysis_carterae.AAC.1